MGRGWRGVGGGGGAERVVLVGLEVGGGGGWKREGRDHLVWGGWVVGN